MRRKARPRLQTEAVALALLLKAREADPKFLGVEGHVEKFSPLVSLSLLELGNLIELTLKEDGVVKEALLAEHSFQSWLTLSQS